MTCLPLSFSTLSELENLDISDNAIVKFPQPLLKLKKLKNLNIERNRIQRFSLAEEEDIELYKSTCSFFQQLSHVRVKGNPVKEHKHLKII